MKSTVRILTIASALFLVACGGSVPHVSGSTACTSDFRNDTQAVLSDNDLEIAWQHAQKTIAEGNWVINAIDCDNRLNATPPPCQYQPADARANSEHPNCLSVKGTNGDPSPGIAGEQSGNSIAFDISKGHDRAWALASYESENVIAERLGFPMGNR